MGLERCGVSEERRAEAQDSEFRDPVKRRRSPERRYGWSKPSKKSAKHMTSKAQIEIVNFAKKCFT
jgi:hypothetical protein